MKDIIKFLSQDYADLIHIELGIARLFISLFIIVKHLEHYEDIVVVILDLGTLIGQYVFQYQWMNSIARAKFLQNIRLM